MEQEKLITECQELLKKNSKYVITSILKKKYNIESILANNILNEVIKRNKEISEKKI